MGDQASFTYDVVLSFRGDDTRSGFTENLYKALSDRGIYTFIDDSELQRGDEISPSVLKAIQDSKIAIIILSENYAFSTWCLEELTAILQCYEEPKSGHLVLPVFYEVDPSDVRHCRGTFGEALAKHNDGCGVEKVNKWKTSLHKVANLSGFHFRTGGGDILEFIEAIIEEVYKQVGHVPLHISDHIVGIESRVDEVNLLLDLGSDGVVQLGIWGIGGIGKSTIARAVYDSISDQFEGLCFLHDVRENSRKFGLEHLQETMLYEMCGLKIKVGHPNEGIPIIRQRLCQKKVLLVLDDVDNLKQLQVIAGASDWFGPGSRVIITTRDKHLLQCHGVEKMYSMEALNERESLVLLSWNAFKSDKVDPSYADILKRVLTHTSGLPLALRVVGSFLFGKSIDQWKSALDRFERIPHNHIQTVLLISFDSLDQEEQDIFLDIACFFNGCKLEDVEDILGAHYGGSMKDIINILIKKSLIKIDKGLVTLHNLIEDMGKEIVRKESPREPSERSRLWFFDDIVHVLKENSESSKIESLFLDFPKYNGKVCWDGNALKKMRNLKTLVVRNVRFNRGPKHLPNSLRVLEWWGYPSPSLPDDFHPKKLGILKLPENCLTTSKPIQGVINLTVLDFSHSNSITHIPDVSGLPNLEKISFEYCKNLIQIHDSVGYLGNLKTLDADGCNNLKTFPPIRLTSLEQLNLSHCSILESFPEILGKMGNVTELCIEGSPIKELPFSIINLNRLRKLKLHICGIVQIPNSIVMLPELCLVSVSRCEGLWLSKPGKGEESETLSSNTEHLTLSYCNISDDFFPKGLIWFANVKDLDLSGNNFTIFHACLKECHFLRSLNLDDCRLIREIVGIPQKLETFSAKECVSLKYLDLAAESHSLRELILDDCVNLQEIIGDLPNLNHFSAKNCTSLTSRCKSMLMNQESVEAGNKMFSLPGKKIPDWFALHKPGESIDFFFRNKFPAISVCLVIGHVNEKPISVKFSPEVFVNGNKLSFVNQLVYNFRIATDHILLFDVRLLKSEDNGNALFSDNEWNHVVISYVDHITDNEVPIRLVAKYSGIHVFNQTSGLEDIRFTIPQKTLINANLDPTNSMMGGAFLSATVQTLVEKLASTEFLDCIKNTKLNDSLLRQLKTTLLTLQVVLDDAEEKQINNSAVKQWLDDLKNVIFDVEDLLNKISYDSLQCMVENTQAQNKSYDSLQCKVENTQAQNKTNQVLNFLSSPFHSIYREMNTKMKIMCESLQLFAQYKDIFGLQTKSARPSSSVVNESVMVGRKDNKETIMNPQNIMTKRPQEDQTMVLSPTLTSIQSSSPTDDVVKGLVPQPTFPVKRPLADVGGEISENLSEDEVYVTTVQKDPPVIQQYKQYSEGDDVELESISCEGKSSSNTEGSDSDDPFDLVNRKLLDSGMETIFSGERSGDASMNSIREAINGLELLMVNDLSEVSSDPAKLSEIHQLLDLLSTSSHPKVTVEVKEAIVDFKKNVFLSFQEFQSAAESVNKLKNFERQLAIIQQKTVAGKGQRTDLKNTIKKVSLAMKAGNSRKKELEAENATLRKQLDTNERDLEQVVLNLKNQEETLSTYSTSYASLNEQAGALLKQTDDLLAASSGIKQDGEAAELKQSRIKLTWSIDLTSQLNKMKKTILGFF